MRTRDGDRCPRSTLLRQRIASALGVRPAAPATVRTGRSWTRDGIDGIELSWAVDNGPETEARIVRPTGRDDDLPAILLLHAHDGVKFYGKEKVSDGPEGVAPGVEELRQRGYGGLCVATELARAGFAVLVHDAYQWGSRRVEWSDLPERARAAGMSAVPAASSPDDLRRRYDAAAREHEHALAKIAILTGTSLAALVAVDDLTALAVLRAAPGVDARRIAAVGFSGGGARAAHLLACSEPADLQAAVITASMSTFADIADGHADGTSWSMITPGLSAVCDWPDVAGCAAPVPLLVQYASHDPHFGHAGMLASEEALTSIYSGTGALTTTWYDEPHRFGAAMQKEAARWLTDRLVCGSLDSPCDSDHS
ncbi:dienelactone hydrolase family protein [Rhodococcus sp. MEB064]|uniref:dienelactone hydrolase family protein n=1 Tax=Rhodococcus sp. MEB064 TaxID=1587522 RepID=UPI0005AC301C|nr:hypothetical protein [Rhodococcus sp. MEB064]KIQ10866.1 hypothetical protein RU01_19035 [Rhodococcus sp. MEB064]